MNFGDFLPTTTDELMNELKRLFLGALRDEIVAGDCPSLPETPGPRESSVSVMTLATVDWAGFPDARNVTIKDIDPEGFWFCTDPRSPKVRQLSKHPGAAAVIYWPLVGPGGMQIRVRGEVHEDKDPLRLHAMYWWALRGREKRASALASIQSEEIASNDTGRSWFDGRRRLEMECDQFETSRVNRVWRAYILEPSHVEIWEGTKDRQHRRTLFLRKYVEDTAPTDIWHIKHLLP